MVELVPGLGNEIRKSSKWTDVKLSLLFHLNKTSLMYLGNFLILLLVLINFHFSLFSFQIFQELWRH